MKIEHHFGSSYRERYKTRPINTRSSAEVHLKQMVMIRTAQTKRKGIKVSLPSIKFGEG
jgi:hypothetical protein